MSGRVVESLVALFARSLSGALLCAVFFDAGLSSATLRAGDGMSDLTGPWQLFVDDAVVARREGVERVWHAFTKHPQNPVLRPDRPWEGTCVYLYGTVLPMEDGSGYRMWYHSLPGDDDFYRLLYATSVDGLSWEKPALGLVEHEGSTANNIFIRRGRRDHIPSVMLVPGDGDPTRRYAMVNFDGDASGYLAAWSPDGLRWRDASRRPVFDRGGDVGQFFRDPRTGKYLGYVKNTVEVAGSRRRAVARIESADLIAWSDPELVLAPDDLDDRWAAGVQRTHFYGLSAFAYETVYLGFLWVFRATDDEGYFDGPIFVELVTSRDGVRWERSGEGRVPILPLGARGAWDSGMVFTAQQPVVRDGRIRLWYGGFDCSHAAKPPWHGAVGLATLRKDGFASLDSAEGSGEVVTRRLVGASGALRVNHRAHGGGSVRVEVLDAAGMPIVGYGLEDCSRLAGDSVDAAVSWGARRELPEMEGPLRLRFVLERAELFSFTAGEEVVVLDEPRAPPSVVLFDFETGWREAFGSGRRLVRHGDIRIEANDARVLRGRRSTRLGSPFSPLQTLEIEGSRAIGDEFTLALALRTKGPGPFRILSSHDDRGPIGTSDLVLDVDRPHEPTLRLVLRGIETRSAPVDIADGEPHHVAVTYRRGEIRFWVDGEELGRARVPGGGTIELHRELRVGGDTAHGRVEQLVGEVDDVLVARRALSGLEIARLAREGGRFLDPRAAR